MDPPKQRLVFLDVLRLVAAVQMIQGHAIDAVLAPSYRAGPAFAAWTFARGLTSVMFLFTAGYSFALAEARAGSAAKRVRRALLLIALGYLMHAPFALLLGAPREPTLKAALQVDVLQCIGVSLLSLELLARFWRGERERIGRAAFGTMLLFSLAPIFAGIEVDGVLRPLTSYLSPQGGSLFPLVPWTGYVLCGFALGTVGRGKPERIPVALAGSGGFALAMWAALTLSPDAHAIARCYVKLACVLLLAAALARARLGPLPGWLARLSGETLFLYLSHVVILYADQVGLQARWGRQHAPWFGLVLAALLLFSCSLGALFWRSLRRPRASGTRAPQTP